MAAFKTYSTGSGRPISETLKLAGDRAFKLLGNELYAEGQGIVEASATLCPVDTSALRSSRYVQPPAFTSDKVRVEMGYGGPAAKINPKTGESTDAYALFVHENLEAHHPVGTAKFLELPFNQATRGMARRVAQAIKAKMRTGGGQPPESEATP